MAVFKEPRRRAGLPPCRRWEAGLRSLGTPDNPAIVAQVAVGNGPSRVAYAAIMLNTGAVFLRVTQDAGVTWSPGVQLGSAVSTSSGLSLQSFNDNVYVGFSTSGGSEVAAGCPSGKQDRTLGQTRSPSPATVPRTGPVSSSKLEAMSSPKTPCRRTYFRAVFRPMPAFMAAWPTRPYCIPPSGAFAAYGL